jgi:hypothetical protein
MYSIDTSAILDGWVRHYPPDIFPGLWAKIEILIENGGLVATEEVLLELKKRDDAVYRWALKQRSMFRLLDDRIQMAVADVLMHHPRLVGARANRSGADAFVIALAAVEHCTVVTGESATNSTSRPNIPDVCAAMEIRCISLLQLIREQGWVFV